MAIEIHQTPNPNARKFVLTDYRFESPLNLSDVTLASSHPLAARLFALGDVYNVFMAQDFVTVNKLPGVPWDSLESRVLAAIEAWRQSL